VPLLIAGGGERVTLRQVAQYADMANFAAHAWAGSAFSLADVRRKYAVLASYCAELARPPESILRSHLSLPLVLAETPAAVVAKLDRLPAHVLDFWRSSLVAGTPAEVIAHYRGLMTAGVRYFIAGFLRGPLERDETTLRLLAERVMPALQAGAA
jgi:alkanesulfonate monooxygenase SsuD/methylene tetrahydromethanopterin reductase-like flavin-dependent oxidoreductase (luciferase family)